MITLDTPIIIYPDEYNGEYFVRLEVEVRLGIVTLYLAPSQIEPGHVYLGVKETTEEGQTKVRFPELMRTCVIQQNLENPDPAIATLFRKLTGFLEDAEKIVLAHQDEPGGLAMVPYQLGTTEWSLAGSFSTIAGRTIGLKDVTPPAPEQPVPSVGAPVPEFSREKD